MFDDYRKKHIIAEFLPIMTSLTVLLNKGEPAIDIIIIPGRPTQDNHLLDISLSILTPDML